MRDIFFDWLREHRPDLVERYERLYAKSAYLSAAERRKIELAAGAPWLRRMDRDPFRDRHRGGRRPPDAAAPDADRPTTEAGEPCSERSTRRAAPRRD